MFTQDQLKRLFSQVRTKDTIKVITIWENSWVDISHSDGSTGAIHLSHFPDGIEVGKSYLLTLEGAYVVDIKEIK